MRTIRSVRKDELPWAWRQWERWRGVKRRARHPAQQREGLYVRALRAWLIGGDPPATVPVRLARFVSRRPSARTSVSWKGVAGDLRRDAKLIDKLVRQSEQGQRPAQVRGISWRRGPFGIRFLNEGPGAEGINYRTVASDIAAIADELNGAAKWERRG